MDASERQSDQFRTRLLLQEARSAAFGEGEYIGQESFMAASEILALAEAVGIGPDSLVLDLCYGVGGPALYLIQQLRCRIVGMDRSQAAVRLAKITSHTGALTRADFIIGDVNYLPLLGGFDSALLLETLLAIRDKAKLLQEVRRMLTTSGRFGLTLEVGEPLSFHERRRCRRAMISGLSAKTIFYCYFSHRASNCGKSKIGHRRMLMWRKGSPLPYLTTEICSWQC